MGRPPGTTIFVGNISYDTTEDQLKDVFSQAGNVLSFRLMYDHDTGRPKGFGFCEYEDKDTAMSARRNLNGHMLNNRPLRVDLTESDKQNAALNGISLTPSSAPSSSLSSHTSKQTLAPSNNTQPSSQAKLPHATLPSVLASANPSLAAMSLADIHQTMLHLKKALVHNPNEIRELLANNPRLAQAILQGQIMLGMVPPFPPPTQPSRPPIPTATSLPQSSAPQQLASAPRPATQQRPLASHTQPQQRPPSMQRPMQNAGMAPPGLGMPAMGAANGAPMPQNVPPPPMMRGPPMMGPQPPMHLQQTQGMPPPQHGMHMQQRLPPPQRMPPPGRAPQQGMPPQGMPPQGMPPQGMPPQGMPPQGMPPQGMPPQGMTPQGIMGQQGMGGRGMGPPPQGMGAPQGMGTGRQGMGAVHGMGAHGMGGPPGMASQQGMAPPQQGMGLRGGMPPQQQHSMGPPQGMGVQQGMAPQQGIGPQQGMGQGQGMMQQGGGLGNGISAEGRQMVDRVMAMTKEQIEAMPREHQEYIFRIKNMMTKPDGGGLPPNINSQMGTGMGPGPQPPSQYR